MVCVSFETEGKGREGALFHPGDVETAGDEGVGVRHLLDDLAGGLAGAVARLGVHQDEERVGLLGAAAHDVLQGGDVLERVQGHHAVVVVARQQEHGGILDAVVLRDADVVERGVPVAVSRGHVKGGADTDTLESSFMQMNILKKIFY